MTTSYTQTVAQHWHIFPSCICRLARFGLSACLSRQILQIAISATLNASYQLQFLLNAKKTETDCKQIVGLIHFVGKNIYFLLPTVALSKWQRGVHTETIIVAVEKHSYYEEAKYKNKANKCVIKNKYRKLRKTNLNLL